MDKINLGDGTQGSGDNGLVGGGKINANYIALVQAVLGVTIWSNGPSENLDLTTLNTTDKSSIKAAINELLERTKLIDDSLTSSIFKTWSVDKLVATFIQASDLAGYLPLAGGTLTGTLTVDADVNLIGVLRSYINGSSQAHQRMDTRIDATDYARMHWYGNNSSGVTSNFRSAWYDGSNYINVTSENGTVTFGGNLAATGNVGIGTTNPQAKLHLTGDILMVSTLTEGIRWFNNQDELFVLRKNSDGGQISLYSDESNKYIRLNAKGSSVFNNGNLPCVGINLGSTSPSETLDVNGNVKISGTVLPETNNVQTVGSVNLATIGSNINVVVVNSSLNCELKILTTTNIARIKIINITSVNVSFSSGTGVTINNLLDNSILTSESSGTLTKIAPNSWIVSK